MFSLQVEYLQKKFGSKTVFENISLDHNEGVLGIAGPNGSGKTTLLRCLAGLLTPDGGSITWRHHQQELSKVDLQQNMGYAASYINLYQELSLMENLTFIMRLRGQNCSEKECREMLDFTGVGDHSDQPFGRLSTGQQQRARLSAALITDPSILLLDEPGSGLDPEGKNLIAELVNSFRNKEKLIILASNDREELDLSDRVYSVASRSLVQ